MTIAGIPICLLHVCQLPCFCGNADCDKKNLTRVFFHDPGPETCVFASTARDHPIHLWDATTGQVCLRL